MPNRPLAEIWASCATDSLEPSKAVTWLENTVFRWEQDSENKYSLHNKGKKLIPCIATGLHPVGMDPYSQGLERYVIILRLNVRVDSTKLNSCR